MGDPPTNRRSDQQGSRHGGRAGYRAAEEQAAAARARPKELAVERSPRLRAIVSHLLRKGWSPASIAGRLPIDYPTDQACRVSREGAPEVPGAEWRSAIPNREVDVSRPGSDLYALLGVAPTAGAAEIARAYRRRVREVHPDTAASAPDPAELRALQEAYLVLRDPARRAEYDADRARQAEYDADRARQAASPRVSRSVPVPVRVRSRAAPAAERLRAGPVRVEPLSPRRVQK